jgi:hypothetical protein
VKLGGPEFSEQVLYQRQRNLRLVATGLLNSTGRPCPRCGLVCPKCHSTTCDCNCEATCIHAPMSMTSDDDFPIEERIAPLVYAFHSLYQCPPCWSCEGHLGLDGKLQRLPAVWFYASSQVFVGMIGDYVSGMWVKRKLSTPWRVVVARTDLDSAEPAYSLEPDLRGNQSIALSQLQDDVDVLAGGLVDDMKSRTRTLLRQVDEFLQTDHT